MTEHVNPSSSEHAADLPPGRTLSPEGILNPLPLPVPVALQRTAQIDSLDQALWSAIRNRTGAMGFNQYFNFINRVLGEEKPAHEEAALHNPRLAHRRNLMQDPLTGVDAYQLLKAATEAFLLSECGVRILPPKDRNGNDGDSNQFLDGEAFRFARPITFGELQERLQQYLGNTPLPYLNRIVTQLGLQDEEPVNPFQYGILRSRVNCPLLIELIWSYWHEEGMLVQSINAISRRFQNRRSRTPDPLAHLELDPLRPLSSLLWGYIQDEPHRLTVQRRAYEYDHHYGLILEGKAIAHLQSADRRSKFIEAFHNLLHMCTIFFKADDDTTMIADAFPLLNALRELHLILAEGAHNQFGDLPWTARVEMLIQKWLMARPEMREFLRGRYMVPYEEPWMGAVDTMKTLQGWNDVNTTHFLRLANFGEQLLLSIRYADWIGVIDPQRAGNWARYWRAEVQGYMHAYRAVTGVDLTIDEVGVQNRELRYMQPSQLLSRQQSRGTQWQVLANPEQPALPQNNATTPPPHTFRERRALRS